MAWQCLLRMAAPVWKGTQCLTATADADMGACAHRRNLADVVELSAECVAPINPTVSYDSHSTTGVLLQATPFHFRHTVTNMQDKTVWWYKARAQQKLIAPIPCSTAAHIATTNISCPTMSSLR